MDFHWVRLHYLYPDEIDDELIAVIASEPKIVKYLDIPIQHCNSKILSLMNRRGDGEYLRWLFQKLRDQIPGLILRTSVITGLPGEGEEEFAELCTFLKDVKLERVGAFPFSPEEGTPAAKMEDPTPKSEKNRRFDKLCAVQNSISLQLHKEYIGKTLRCLIDGTDKDCLTARTEGGRLVRLHGDATRIGTFAYITITDATTWSLTGELTEKD